MKKKLEKIDKFLTIPMAILILCAFIFFTWEHNIVWMVVYGVLTIVYAEILWKEYRNKTTIHNIFTDKVDIVRLKNDKEKN